MTVSDALVTQFETDWEDIPELADVWVLSTQEELNAFSRVTAIVSQQSIGTFPLAPLSKRTVGATIELVSPLGGRDAGATQLEPVVLAILDYLDTRLQHEAATAFLYGEQFAYRIPISVIANKED